MGYRRPTHLCDLTHLDGPDPDLCQVPPPGWWCSRDPDHDGPCAARAWRDDPWLTYPAADRYAWLNENEESDHG